jgi:hypothetical protein
MSNTDKLADFSPEERREMVLQTIGVPNSRRTLHYARRVDEREMPQFTCECGYGPKTWFDFKSHVRSAHAVGQRK